MRLKNSVSILPQCFGSGSLLKRSGFILLLSHMRGYTSVLSHVIGSHPRVTGYAECHQKLRNSLDLIELSSKVQASSGKSVANRYVFDKLLHNNLVADGVLARPDVKVLIMVRDPAPTINSILKIKSGGLETLKDACAYYTERLDSLYRYAERRRGQFCFIRAESVKSDTVRCLDALSSYLHLDPPLTERYDLFPNTGKPKYGDPSRNIRAGFIIKDAREPVASIVDESVPGAHCSETEGAVSAYDRLCEFGENNSDLLIGTS